MHLCHRNTLNSITCRLENNTAHVRSRDTDPLIFAHSARTRSSAVRCSPVGFELLCQSEGLQHECSALSKLTSWKLLVLIEVSVRDRSQAFSPEPNVQDNSKLIKVHFLVSPQWPFAQLNFQLKHLPANKFTTLNQ